MLSTALPCQEQNICLEGHVRGHKHNPNSAHPGLPVHLHQGILGSFRPTHCASFCNEASIQWQQGNYDYQIALKGESKAMMIRAANSAIDGSGKWIEGLTP